MISKKIAEQFGGDIELKSKFGEGTTFTFRIRLEDHNLIEREEEEEKQEVRHDQHKLVFDWQPLNRINGEV